jgi:glycosyltransferase involved in cell wall biosynthesis
MTSRDSTEKRLRVLVVAPAMPPDVGGAEVIAETVVRCLIAEGVDVNLLTGTPTVTIADAVRRSGGRVTVDDGRPPGDVIGWEHGMFARAQLIWEQCQQRPPDIVHVFSHDAAVSASIAAVTVPVVGTFNEMATEASVFGALRSRFVYGLPQLTVVTASSRMYASIAARHGVSGDRIRKLITGIDTNWLSSGDADRGRRVLNYNDTRPLIVCPSRFTPRKGQLELVQAMSTMPIPCQLALVGSPHSGSDAYRQTVVEAIGNREDITIVPGLSHEDMADVYAATDLVVQPSYDEGLGLSALEALAAARPLVATRVNGFSDYLEHEGNAILVDPGDVSALSCAIERLLSDEELRGNLAQAGSATALRYDISQTARDVMRVYGEVRRAEGDSYHEVAG